jgi:hypothetical protein
MVIKSSVSRPHSTRAAKLEGKKTSTHSDLRTEFVGKKIEPIFEASIAISMISPDRRIYGQNEVTSLNLTRCGRIKDHPKPWKLEQ